LLSETVQCNPVLSASRQSTSNPQEQGSSLAIVPFVFLHGAYEQVSVSFSQYAPFPRHFVFPHKQGNVFGEVPLL
jgi:hypothetical protein